MTAPRLAILGALAATLMLAACSSPSPSDPAEPGTPTPTTPAVVSLSDLEFSIDSPETIDALVTARTDLETWYGQYTSSCTAEQAGSGEPGECLEGILTTLQKVNAVKTVFDFGPWSTDDFASGDYSGLTALEPTLTTNQAASDEGSTVVDSCYYFTGGEGCADKVQAFLDTVGESIDAMQTWTA